MAGSFTDIEPKKGGIGAGDHVMNTGGKGSGASAPKNVTRVNTDDIRVGKRLRGVNHATVDKLYDDIRINGLLQPIGVQQSKEGAGIYDVVYGVHRFLAFKKGWAEAERLIAERTNRDEEAYDMAYMFQSIPAIIYDYEMPMAYAQLKEITENLIRQGLSKEEKAVHEAKYTHLIKRLKLVATADEKRKTNASNQYKEGVSHDVTHPPTATEKATADLGVTKMTLHRSHEQVNLLAKAVARDMKLAPPLRITPETPPSQEAEHTIRLAEKAAQEKAKAVQAGEDPRKVYPIDPQPSEQISMRVDLTDPVKAAQWFTERVDAANKPLTLSFLETMARELLAFVKSRRHD